MLTWDITAGEMTDAHGKVILHGYSGHEWAKNNPDAVGVQGMGPLPIGRWKLIRIYDSPNTGKATIVLEPCFKTTRSAFRIHGDSIRAPGTASHGCIVNNVGGRAAREALWNLGDRDLEVIA